MSPADNLGHTINILVFVRRQARHETGDPARRSLGSGTVRRLLVLLHHGRAVTDKWRGIDGGCDSPTGGSALAPRLGYSARDLANDDQR